MKCIYIILSQSGSIVSKAIKVATHRQFNHCSLALDAKLDRMYSMGRVNPNNPWVGRLVKEKPNVGTYARFKQTRCRILKVAVTNDQYQCIEDQINVMYPNKNYYRYNVRGLLLGKFGYVRHSDRYFYCTEFVAFVLTRSGVDTSFLSAIPLPEEFMNMPDIKLIYEGQFNDINETIFLD